MELSWSTFLLEMINFLVLVWILKHFFYKPVMNIIIQRRTDIEAGIVAAQRLQDEANNLKSEYENRLADWGQERQQAKDELTQELNQERSRQLEALQAMLTQEREKARVKEARRRIKSEHEIEHRALQQGAQFASRLLAQASGPELETRLLSLLLDGLAGLSSEQVTKLRTQWGEVPESILVASAYPLTADQRRLLEEVLVKVSGLNVPVRFQEEPELLAGLRISIGSWMLHTDVRHDLSGFAEFAHAAG